MDVERVKATGPWVLVRPEKPKTVTTGGIYLPEGNLLERLGHSTARVLSASNGYWLTKIPNKKPKFMPMEVKAGDRVLFRGHLQGAFKFDDVCFLHVDDIVGVISDETEVDPALPHGN